MKYRPKQEQVWSDDLECHVSVPQIIVLEEDDGEPTGILDAHGRELFKYRRGKLGFEL